MKKPVSITIEVPVEILTEKIAPNKTDSIFYAENNIARVCLKGREYMLTTAGEYRFATKNNDKKTYTEKSPIVKKLTDSKINTLGKEDRISNWGWFGINVWVAEKGEWNCLGNPTDCYSRYDEALDAFKAFVKKDLEENVFTTSE